MADGSASHPKPLSTLCLERGVWGLQTTRKKKKKKQQQEGRAECGGEKMHSKLKPEMWMLILTDFPQGESSG